MPHYFKYLEIEFEPKYSTEEMIGRGSGFREIFSFFT